MLKLFVRQEDSQRDVDKEIIEREDFGLCPKLFYTESGHSVDLIAREAVAVAIGTGRGLDPLAIAEQALLEFPLGNRTVFTSVKRLQPWEHMVFRDGVLSVERKQLASCPPDILEYLSDQVCDALDEGAALELTGGMDSRLMLAAGLRRGVKPKLAFTIGDANTYDVMMARAIAKEFGFPHLTLPVVVNEDRIKQDTIDFVRASGYGVNATCYGWLPGTLAALDGKRTAQITGLVGEIAGSSYYTPFDFLIGPLHLARLWVKYRLMRPWIDWRRVWPDHLQRKLEDELTEEALQDLNSFEGNWRERTDLFYKHKKIGRWAIPVMDASNTYYTVVAPLMSPEYCAWAVSLPVAERIRRGNERALLRRAHPQLADFKAPDGVMSPKLQMSTLGKILKRLKKQRRDSALGTVMTAVALARDREIRAFVQAMAHESGGGFVPAEIDHLLDFPEEQPELLGSLITAAVAWHDLQQRTPAES